MMESSETTKFHNWWEMTTFDPNYGYQKDVYFTVPHAIKTKRLLNINIISDEEQDKVLQSFIFIKEK